MATLLGTTARSAELDQKTNDTLYALGLAVARDLRDFQIGPDELVPIVEGLTDAVSGKQPRVHLEDFYSAIHQLGATRSRQAEDAQRRMSENFLREMARQPGAIRTEPGSVFLERARGVGEMPAPADTASLRYRLSRMDGSTIEDLTQTVAVTRLPIGKANTCLRDALLRMHKGGKAIVYCPSRLAGDTSTMRAPIPAGAAVVYEIDLVDVVAASIRLERQDGHEVPPEE